MNILLYKKPGLKFNKYSFINAVKTILACIIGIAISQFFPIHQPQWVLITILIVMAAQYRVGAAFMKGYARVIATVMGASIASAILFLFSNNHIITYAILFFFLMIFLYFAGDSKDYSYAYALGAVTMVIILVSDNPQLKFALDRLIEILLGVIIAVLVSRFIYPIRAEKILYKNIAKTLNRLKVIYQYSIHEEKTFKLKSKELHLEDDVIQNFVLQPTLLKEACVESINVRKYQTKFVLLLRLQRGILRSIYMLHYTLRISLRHFSEIINMAEFKNIHTEIIEYISYLEKKISSKAPMTTTINLQQDYEMIIVKLKSMFDLYSFENKNKIHAFIFCLGHLIKVLSRTEKMISELKPSFPIES